MWTSAFAALLAASSAATPPPPTTQVQDWKATIADDGAGSLLFRAMTLEETGLDEDTLVLSLDRVPGNCDQVLISMAVVSQELHGLPGGMLSPSFFGEMQVDRLKPRRFDYRFLTDPHFDNVILVQLTGWERSDDDLFAELRQGQKWKFRFVVDGEEHQWRFSLMGVTKVLDLTHQQCLAKSEETGSTENVLEQAALSEEYAL
ncbi:MAG: hypothetical protein GX093_02035 [Xanthomonadaceae bacterium]|nr:hypothetical protein [Xanthomonadaceae bacterium]